MSANDLSAYSGRLTSFHTASLDNNPFTVYVVTVRKEDTQWQVFRRYKEWEDLRNKLQHKCGSAPPFPGKILFGRMRPEVIETRVLGLNHFLQMVLASPIYARLDDVSEFLERERNLPPPGLDDLVLHPQDTPDEQAAEGSAEGTRQAQLKRLVETASQAFIAVSQPTTALDASYLNERAAMYAVALRGCMAGTTASLKPPPTAPPSPAALDEAMARLLAAPPPEPAEAALARSTAIAAAAALEGIPIQGKHEVLVPIG